MQLTMRLELPGRLSNFLSRPEYYLTDTIKRADKLVFTLLQASIKTNAPRKSGNLARSIDIDFVKRKVYSKAIYSRAVELGHYAEPKGPYLLKFIDKGKSVSLKSTRSKKQPYFFKAQSQNKQQIIQIYEDALHRLMERV